MWCLPFTSLTGGTLGAPTTHEKAATPEEDAPISLLFPDEQKNLAAREAAIGTTDFICRWVSYGEERTDAPAVFHHMAALVLVATAINRNRWLDLQQKTVYPSIFAITLAPSGARKTTPLNYARDAATDAFPDSILASSYTAEALAQDLAVRASATGSRGTMLVDEAGRLLSTMRKSGYAEALKDLLSELWDAPASLARKLMKGSQTLKDVYVSALMATTTSRFAELMTIEDVDSGFLARFLPAHVTSLGPKRPMAHLAAATAAKRVQLHADAKALLGRLAQKPGPMIITADALDRYTKAEDALDEWAARQYHSDQAAVWARRLQDYVLRLAVVYAVSEGAVAVDVPQVLRAIRTVDDGKEAALRLIGEITNTADQRRLDKVVRFINKNPGLTKRDLQRRANLRTAEIGSAIGELISQSRIREDKSGGSPCYYPL